MTYIEFFDSVSLENVCACLACPPEKVVILGSDGKKMERYAKAYRELLKSRGFDVAFEVRTVNKNDLNGIFALLCSVMEAEKNFSVGLNSGDELFLVATGMLYEKYGRTPKLHRFNLNKGTISDLHKDGRIECFEAPRISVAEVISLFGGSVVFEDEKQGATFRWEISDDFLRDIDKIWGICSSNPKAWNQFANTLGFLDRNRAEMEGVRSTCECLRLENVMKREGARPSYSLHILNRLKKLGLITDFSKDERYSVSYKNAQVMRVLTTAGLALEMKVYLAALKAKNHGRQVYDDVMNGVLIDWDGRVHGTDEAVDTENEIDVMMTRGGVPVFVSCKNGFVNANELYKLSSVAERFGGPYSKKVLIASSLDPLGKNAEYIRERAADMDIRVVDNFASMSEEDILRCVSSFWR